MTGLRALGQIGAAGLLTVALGACSGGAAPATGADFTPPVTTTTTASPEPTVSPEPEARAPLSHVGTTTKVADRSAVAVVTEGDSPRGLGKADIVVEELSDVSRWIGMFQSTDANVGPVAAARPSDLMLLRVLHPVYAFAGGSPSTVERAGKSELSPVDALTDPDPFSGSGGDQDASTKELRAAAKAPAAVPLLQFVGPDADPPAGTKRAKEITVRMKDRKTQVWRYDSGTTSWRSKSEGPDLAPKNLILQFVDYKSIQLKHPHGPFVPSARVLGTGRAVVATDGRSLDGVWRKAGARTLTTYSTSRGLLARFVPGQTMIVLVPSGSSVKIT